MTRIITIANQKGGVGKTTTAQNVGASLSYKGYKVLLIDFDPQGNLSYVMGADNVNKPTIYEVLKGQFNITEAIQQTKSGAIIPANILLSGADREFTKATKDVAKKMRTKVFEATIRTSVATREAQANQVDVITYSPVSPTSEGYNSVAAEIIKGGGKRG